MAKWLLWPVAVLGEAWVHPIAPLLGLGALMGLIGFSDAPVWIVVAAAIAGVGVLAHTPLALARAKKMDGCTLLFPSISEAVSKAFARAVLMTFVCWTWSTATSSVFWFTVFIAVTVLVCDIVEIGRRITFERWVEKVGGVAEAARIRADQIFSANPDDPHLAFAKYRVRFDVTSDTQYGYKEALDKEALRRRIRGETD